MEDFKKWALAIGGLGIVAYLICGILFSYNYDFNSWAIVSNNFLTNRDLYNVRNYFYTPVWGYFLSFIVFIGSLFGIAPTITQNDYNVHLDNYTVFSEMTGMVTDFGFSLLLKVVMLLTTCVLAYLVYEYMMEITNKDERKSIFAAVLCLISPLFVFIVGRLAMFESLMVLFFFISLLFLFKENYLLTGAFWMISLLTKFFTAYFVFILVAYILVKYKNDVNEGLKKIGFAVFGAIVAALIIFWPQILDGNFFVSIEMYTGRIFESINPVATDVFTIFTRREGFGDLMNYEKLYKFTVLFLMTIASIILAVKYYKKGIDDKKLFTTYLIVTIVAVFLLPLGGEQFYLTPFPFLAIAAMLIDEKIGIVALLSSFGFALSSVVASFSSDHLIFQYWSTGTIPNITNYVEPAEIRIVFFTLGIVLMLVCFLMILKRRWGDFDG